MDAHTTRVTLLARLRDRTDQEAWREFYDRYGELIRSFARKGGSQAANYDDVLQDVMISLTRSMEQFRYDPDKGRFRSYLKTITIRAILKRRCQDRRHSPLGDVEKAIADPQLDELWEESWRRYHIRRALRRVEAEFTHRDRCAFAEYAVNGQNSKETARTYGMSVEQVWQAKSRILKRLSAIIEEQVRDEG